MGVDVHKKIKFNCWDLERLRIFVTVAKNGSLTRTAAVLGIAQPAVSRQITRFESECGGQLFNRTGRGVTLTALGEIVLPRVISILDEASELSILLEAGATAPRGDVRIGILPSLYLNISIPLFLKISSNFPSIKLQIFEGSAGQIDQWLSTGYIDIGIPYRYGNIQHNNVDNLIEVSSYLIGSPNSDLLKNDTVKFLHLNMKPLVLPAVPSSVRLALDQIAKQIGIKLNIILEADSTQIQKEASKLNDVYTVLPIHAVSEEIKKGTLKAAKIIEPEFNRKIVLGLTDAKPISRATREVARIIRELIAKPRS